MKNNNLINKIDSSELKDLYYCTACIRMTEGNKYDDVYDELISLVKYTIEEEGCVEFFVTPSNPESGELYFGRFGKIERPLNFIIMQNIQKNFLVKNSLKLSG